MLDIADKMIWIIIKYEKRDREPVYCTTFPKYISTKIQIALQLKTFFRIWSCTTMALPKILPFNVPAHHLILPFFCRSQLRSTCLLDPTFGYIFLLPTTQCSHCPLIYKQKVLNFIPTSCFHMIDVYISFLSSELNDFWSFAWPIRALKHSMCNQ